MYFFFFFNLNKFLIFILDILSFFINIIFLISTFLWIFAIPRSIFKIHQISNIIFVICSFLILYLNVFQSNYEESHNIGESWLVSTQIFRFFLIMKQVKFIKKFLKTFKLIIIKSYPIIALFLSVLFFYGLIGMFLQYFNFSKFSFWYNFV